jgi:hypothetical protein
MRRASLSGVMELIDYMVGVYSAHVKSPAAAEYDVAFLLGAPAVNECFHLKAAPNPSRARSIQTAVIDYLDAPNRAAARETIRWRFRLDDPQSGRCASEIMATCSLSTRPAVNKPSLSPMRSTIHDFQLLKRTQEMLDDSARELNPAAQGWLAYHGRYTRSALYPLVRYIDQTRASDQR